MKKPTVIENISIALIDPFPGHPFKVKMDEDMLELITSITFHGVTSPLLLLEREDGRYILLSGHRRKYACEYLKLTVVPALVYRDITLEEATIIMVDENARRERLLPSEKAFAYKLKLEAMKRQGQRSDLTSVQFAPKLAVESIAKNENTSKDTIKRYIRLTRLIPILLQAVDEGELGFMCGVELSFLSPKQQEMLVEEIRKQDYIPNLRQARNMKMAAHDGKLTADEIARILSQVRLDCRVTFRMQPNQLKRLEEESEKGALNRSELLRAYSATGGTVFVAGNLIDTLEEIRADIARVGNLLIMNINRLTDISNNPFIAERQSHIVDSALEENKKLADELDRCRTRVNNMCGHIYDNLEILNKSIF